MKRTILFSLISALTLQACWLKGEKEFTYEEQDSLLLKGTGQRIIPSDMVLPNEHSILDFIEKHPRMDSISKCREMLKKVLDSSGTYTVFVGLDTLFIENKKKISPCAYVFIISGNHDKAGLISKLANGKVQETNLLDDSPFSLVPNGMDTFITTNDMSDSLQISLYDQYTHNGVVHAFE